MNIKQTITFALLLLLASQSHGAMITNGNFQRCDLSGWQMDTDGFGDPGATEDFMLQNSATECSAQISVDAMNSISVFEANTLYTSLDLSADPGDKLLLSFELDFAGADDETILADLFSVFLFDGVNTYGADGLLGTLIGPTSSYGPSTFSTYLDGSFANLTGFSLNFQVLTGFNPTSFSSTLTIDNVSLSNVPTSVSAPMSLALFGIGIFAITIRRRITLK